MWPYRKITKEMYFLQKYTLKNCFFGLFLKYMYILTTVSVMFSVYFLKMIVKISQIYLSLVFKPFTWLGWTCIILIVQSFIEMKCFTHNLILPNCSFESVFEYIITVKALDEYYFDTCISISSKFIPSCI